MTTATAVARSFSRGFRIRNNAISSSPCTITSTAKYSVITQGNVIDVRSQAQLPFKVTSSTTTRFRSYSAARPVKSLSWRSSPVLTTSFRIFTRHKHLKLTMAAVSPVISKTNFSTAALQPQIDALDETVDPVQRQLLEEQCIVLDERDQVIGHDTKRNCHRIVNGDVLLHRAFSVFLFNGKGELLLQQRSKTKITFPLMWTNTCCSHPLYTPSELEEKHAIGVRRAARRRLEVELGIPQNSISLEDFRYLTRIHYKALSNSIWGEHEIDYILFLQKDDLHIDANPDEIQEIRWVTLEQVKEMKTKENVTLTPWFDLILNSSLPKWWNSLESLKKFEDHGLIHKM